MSNVERYHPNGTETIGLYVPSSIPDLAAAESEIDQPYELEMYAQGLRNEYAEVISARLLVIAEGMMVTNPDDENSIEEELGTFEGRIVGFDVHELLAQYRVVVKLRNDIKDQNKTMVISAQQGYESSLFVSDMEQADEISKRQQLLDSADEIPDLVTYLSDVASDLGLLKLNRNTYDYLRNVEEHLQNIYRIKRGILVSLAGCKAYVIEKGGILLPYERSNASDAGYTGEFLGIVPHEIAGVHNRDEIQVCVAIKLYGEPESATVVVQPCHYMNYLEPLSE